MIKVSTGSIDYYLAVPSIISSDLTSTGKTNLVNQTGSLVFRGKKSLPENTAKAFFGTNKTDTGVVFNPKNTGDFLIYSGTITTDTDKTTFLTNLKNVYTGSVLNIISDINLTSRINGISSVNSLVAVLGKVGTSVSVSSTSVVSSTPSIGTQTNPGLSCNDIKTKISNSTDGTYRIKPDTNPAFQVYCDMTTDGGGWTQLWNETNYTNFDYNTFYGLKWTKFRGVSNSRRLEYDLSVEKIIGVDWNGLGNPIYKSYSLGLNILTCTTPLNIYKAPDFKGLGFMLSRGGNIRNTLITETSNYYSQIGSYTNTCNGTNPGGNRDSYNFVSGIPSIFKVYLK